MLFLVSANGTIWLATIFSGASVPGLMGSALLAWTFGLRHALDADHIAAIDVVTRRLMAREQRPILVGLFFSLGHSSVVILATLALILLPFHSWLEQWHAVGGAIGASVSIAFLLVMATANTLTACTQWRQMKAGKEIISGPTGLLSRLFSSVTALIRADHQMFALGFLFGMGFDTATEIGLLSLTTSEIGHGLTPMQIMLLPLLFTAGMALMDSLDTVLMVRAWSWSAGSTRRRARYTFAVTALSATAAGTVALIELAQTASDHGRLPDCLRNAVDAAGDYFPLIGSGIVCGFLALWGAAAFRAARSPCHAKDSLTDQIH